MISGAACGMMEAENKGEVRGLILSVSRRTDIPACYPEWFLNRLREGFVLVRNPMNPRQVSRIALTPDTVDCIVFWTKNPLPLMPYLPEIEAMGYPYLMQMTLTGYGPDAEAALPPVTERIAALRELAQRIGPKRLIWRYDPILLSDGYTAEWHADNFAQLAGALTGCTRRCVLSFLDVYPKIRSRLQDGGFRACTEAEMRRIAAEFAKTAAPHGLLLQTCAERLDLTEFGVTHGACIDGGLIGDILGVPLDVRRDTNQRSGCGCVASIDVGEYNTCGNGCVYCYANHSGAAVARHAAQHDVRSPLLVGKLSADDRVTERRAVSLRPKDGTQLSLF